MSAQPTSAFPPDGLPVATTTLALVGDEERREVDRGRLGERLERLQDRAGLVLVVAAQSGPLVERVDYQQAELVLEAVGDGLLDDRRPGRFERLRSAQQVHLICFPRPKRFAGTGRIQTEANDLPADGGERLLGQEQHPRSSSLQAEERGVPLQGGEKGVNKRRLADLGAAGQQAGHPAGHVAAPQPVGLLFDVRERLREAREREREPPSGFFPFF